MESVTTAAHREAVCSGCLKPSNKLTASSGDQLCEKCKAVFLTAAVLLNEDITAEDTLIPTLVFAKIAGGSPEYAALVKEKEQASGLEIVRLMRAADDWPPQRSQTPEEYAQTLTDYVRTHEYSGWEFVRVIRDVPILRVRPLALIPEMHPGTQILKSVRIQVLSRRVKPCAVGDEYERVLNEQGAHWNENNHGLISYKATDGYLEMYVGTGGEVSPLMAESLSNKLLSWPAYNFPPPMLIAGIYENLLGVVHKRTGRGFAYDLDLYGKHDAHTTMARKIVHAFAAWHVGEGHRARVPPQSRTRVAGVLNRQLLNPDEQLPEDTWLSSDKVWDDVEALSMRFVRLYAGGVGAFITKS
jgi:hypothetical protein